MTMNEVQTLFKEFKDRLENDRTYYLVASSLYKEIEKHGDEVRNPDDIEELLRSTKTKKAKKRDLVLMFYDFVKEKTGEEIDTNLDTKIIIDDPIERQIAVLEYMQTKPIDIEKISDLFMMSDRSMRELLSELEEGVDILGTKVKIKMDRDGSNRYSVISHHPVFLNLTMQEVVTLTAGLLDAAKTNELYRPLFTKIAKDVYDNLTEYGKGRVTRMLKAQGMDGFFFDEIRIYEEHISNSLMTMLKEDCTGNIQINHDGVDYVFASCRLLEYEKGEVVIEASDSRIRKFRVSDIYVCEDNYKRRLKRED